MTTEGDWGDSGLAGKTWSLDFSRGATGIALDPQDRSLLGLPQKIHLRVRGSAKGHPVRLYLATHFMTFHKVIGEFSGSGEQELVADAPPGPGWEWYGGENDGKYHDPLRLVQIRLDANGLKDRPKLELVRITVETACPPDWRCVVLGESEVEGESVEFRARVRALGDAPLAGTLRWRLRNWEGQGLGQGQQPVTIPAGGEEVSVAIPPLAVPHNLRFVEAEFRLDVPGQKTIPAKAYWLAPLAEKEKMDSTLRPESPMGMGLYLYRTRGEARERCAQMAQEAGVKWTREEFPWGRAEPREGEFHWKYQDGIVDCAKRHGISVFGNLSYWSSWTKPYTDAGIDDFANYAKTVVKRYGQQVKQWEIWNEPNWVGFWAGSRETFAKLMVKTYAAIHEADPSAEVLGLSPSGIDFKFIEDMLGRKVPFDVLTVHPYRGGLGDQEFIGDLKRVSEMVKLPDGRPRAVWLTEMGWPTSARHQRSGTSRPWSANGPRRSCSPGATSVRSFRASILRTFWYDFRNDGDDPFNMEHNMGIVTADFRLKPAYLAYATLARVVQDRQLAGPVAVPGGAMAFRFVSRGKGDSAIAVWNPTQDGEVELSVRGRNAWRRNAIGEATRLEVISAPGSEARWVRVALKKGAPVYVEDRTVDGAVSLPAGQAEVASDSPFGVCCPWPGMQEAGIKWCRVGAGATPFVNWPEIEKSPGTWDWTAADNELKQLADPYGAEPAADLRLHAEMGLAGRRRTPSSSSIRPETWPDSAASSVNAWRGTSTGSRCGRCGTSRTSASSAAAPPSMPRWSRRRPWPPSRRTPTAASPWAAPAWTSTSSSGFTSSAAGRIST